jgi:hypothetical protein
MEKKKFEEELAESVGVAIDELEGSIKKGGSVIAKVLAQYGGEAIQDYLNSKKIILKEKIKKGLKKNDNGEE